MKYLRLLFFYILFINHAYAIEHKFVWSRQIPSFDNRHWIDMLYHSNKTDKILFYEPESRVRKIWAISRKTGKTSYKKQLDWSLFNNYYDFPTLIFGDKFINYNESDCKVTLKLRRLKDNKVLGSYKLHNDLESVDVIDSKTFKFKESVYLYFKTHEKLFLYVIKNVDSKKPTFSMLFEKPVQYEDQFFQDKSGMLYHISYLETFERVITKMDREGKFLWQNKSTISHLYPSPIVIRTFDKQLVLIGTHRFGHPYYDIETFDIDTGQALSSTQLHSDKPGDIDSFSTIDKDGNLLILDEACVLTKYSPNENGYQNIIYSKPLFSTKMTCFNSGIKANQSGSKIYLRTNGQLFMIDSEYGQWTQPVRTGFVQGIMPTRLGMLVYDQDTLYILDQNSGSLLDLISTNKGIRRVRYDGQGIQGKIMPLCLDINKTV